MKTAVFPGSFDPITNGHLDILKRACVLFDHVILLLAVNPDKQSVFSFEERIAFLKASVKDFDNVSVDSTKGYTVDYCAEHGATHIVRGLRDATDFEYEQALAKANRSLNSKIETVFLLPGDDVSLISSSKVNQLHKEGKEVSPFVPNPVLEAYKTKY